MAAQGADHVSQGDLMRRMRAAEREIQRMKAERRLEAASIGAGGLRVRGGKIQILDASGGVTMTLATDGLTLTGILQVAGSIIATGGALVVTDADGDELFRADADGIVTTGRLVVAGDSILSGDVALSGNLAVTGSITIAPDGTIRSANFDGDLDGNDPGTTGFAMGDDKIAVADLLLRDGVIGDAKLSNLVRTETAGSDVDITTVGGSESTSVALTVPSWATNVSVLATGSAYLAGVADSPSMELYCTIEGDQGIHMATHVDRASATATAHHQRSIATSSVSGDLNVSLNANPINNSGDAFGIRLALSVIAVWSR